MTRNLVVALLLLLAGIALPVLAVKMFGTPWGFGERSAVVLEHVGVSELYPGPRHPDRRTQRVNNDTDFLAGDELRVSSLSMVRFKHRHGEAELYAGGRMVFEKERFELERGRLVGKVTSGRVLVDVGQVGSVEFDEGPFVVVADGQGHAYANAPAAEFRVARKGGSWLSAQAAQGAVLRRGEAPEVGKDPGRLSVSVTCRKGNAGNVIVRGRAPMLSEVLVAGRLVFPNAGDVFEVTLARPEAGTVMVFAKNGAGQTARAQARCGS